MVESSLERQVARKAIDRTATGEPAHGRNIFGSCVPMRVGENRLTDSAGLAHHDPEASAMAYFPDTPADAIGPVIEEIVLIGGREYRIQRPAEPDRLLDHPATATAHQRDGYMPYWADLWPAARMLAKAIDRHPWNAGTKALELGCGLGLPGVVALAKGLEVTFSDYDAAALRFAAANARNNGFTGFQLLQLDWRRPPALQFPLILASDLLYEERNVSPVVDLLAAMLTPDGECWLTDQDRRPAELLRGQLTRGGFHFQTSMVRVTQAGRRIQGTLYRIRRTRYEPETGTAATNEPESPATN